MAIAGAAAVDHGVKKKRMEAAWKAELADLRTSSSKALESDRGNAVICIFPRDAH